MKQLHPSCSVHPHDGASYEPLFGLAVWIRGQLTTLLLLIAALYCWAVAKAARPGLPRLLYCLPVMAIIHAVPLLFHPLFEPLATISATFLAVRLTSGKLLAFIMGRGVLVLPLSLAQFAAVMLAPFMPAQLVASKLALCTPAAVKEAAAQRSHQLGLGSSNAALPAGQPSPARRARAASKDVQWQQVTPTQRYSIDSSSRAGSPTQRSQAAAAAALFTSAEKCSSTDSINTATSVKCSSSHRSQERTLRVANILLNSAVVAAFAVYSCASRQRLAATAVHLGGMVLMWRAMELLMAAASAPARNLLGMTLAPHFRNPFASSSLTDFWARRWNITQGLVLRFWVYEPIVQGRLLATEPWAAHTAAPAAAGGTVSQPATAAASVGSGSGVESHQPGADATAAAAPLGQPEEGAAQAEHSAAGSVPAVGATAAAVHGPEPAAVWPAGLRYRPNARAASLDGHSSAAGGRPPSGRKSLSGGAAPRECHTSGHYPDSSPGIARRGDSASSIADTRSNGSGQDREDPQYEVQQQAAQASSVSASVPLLAGPSAAVAPRWRRQLAAAATFVVSGLEHELFLWYATRTVGWRWFVFFSLQGIILAAEGELRRRCRAVGLALHPAVAVLAVLLVLGVTADEFFWPPLVQPALVHPLLAALPQWMVAGLGGAPWCQPDT